MTSTSYAYSVRGHWAGPPDEVPTVTGAKFLKTLDSLSGINPLFTDWQILRNWKIAEDDLPRQFPLATARKRIDAIVETGVTTDEYNEPTPRDGYTVAGTVGARGPRKVTFTARTADQTFSLEFGEHYLPADLSIVSYPLFKAALLAISAAWGAEWAYATASRREFATVATDIVPGVPGFRIDALPQVPSDPMFPETRFLVPWIGYLPGRRAADVRPSREILSERTRDGGRLMSVTTERFDPMDVAHARGSRILAETMMACADWGDRY
jgi:hypothetical protein